jgi:Domain of unknown function (DUF4861)
MTNTNKALFMLLCLPFGIMAQQITITNDSKADRNNQLVSIAWSGIVSKFSALDKANFKVVNTATNQEVPFQLEYNGQQEPQNLLVQISVKGKGQEVLTLEKGKPTPLEPKTYARYVPERLDDFAWENDKIAFRTYGKALEGTKGDAYGFDVWVKRTDKLIINTRYKHGNYHNDLGDGLDYYHVGKTLGAGNIAPYINGEVVYSKNYHRWKLLDTGALRTTFILEYDAWTVDGMSLTCTKKISLDAGSQMNRVEVTYDFQGRDTLPVVIGIIKRPEQGSIVLDEAEGITAYWEPQHGKDGTTGVAIALTTAVTGTSITKDQILTHTTYRKGKPFVYYTGAAWDKAGEITGDSRWFSYAKAFKNGAVKPMRVKIQ